MDKTEVMDFAMNPALSVPTAIAGGAPSSEAPTNLVSQPGPAPPEFDPNATIAYDASGNPSIPRQADVKTEVFLAGSDSLPIPSEYSNSYSEPPVSDSLQPQDLSPEHIADDISNETPSPYVGDATMPIVAFNETSGLSVPADGTDQFIGSADIGNEPIPRGFDPAAGERSSNAAAFVPSPSSAAAKGSTGKIFAVVGALVVLFVIGAAALGGGWYYYNNYYAVSEPEPTPSPETTIEPTPEPTVDFASSNTDGSNTDAAQQSDSNSDTDANSNTSGIGDLTVGPTPQPGRTSTPQTVVSRPTQPGQTAVPRSTPRPAATPAVRSTPKPTSTRDRKIILQ